MINDDFEIEKMLKTLGLDEKHKALVLELSAYVTPILNFIPRSIPEYTDHGVHHSRNILSLIVKFRDNLSKIATSFSFTQEEIFLLALSAYLHDIGCIIERPNHNLHSAKLLTEDPAFAHLQDKLGAGLLKCLELIAMSHSSSYDLCGISKERLNEKVRLRLICSIFRLLDGCEISSNRISKSLFDILKRNKAMKDEESGYWEGHLSIIELFFDRHEIILDCDDLSKAGSAVKHLEDDLVSVNKVFTEEGFPNFICKIVDLGF